MDNTRECRPGEKILKNFRQSKTRLYLDLFFVLVAFFFIGLLFYLINFLLPIVATVLVILMLAVGFAVYLSWYFTVYTITSIRVEYRSGIISKFQEEICLEDIQTVDTNQDIIGRILSHGDIKIESAGMNIINLKNVENAHAVARQIANLSLEYNKETHPEKSNEILISK